MTKPLAHTFDLLERTALAGERCPQNGANVRSGDVVVLARQGKIRIEISGKNYRRVVILASEHAGRATAGNPDGHPAWKVIDRTGTHYPLTCLSG